MKITKYLLGFALLSLGLTLTSCDQENEGALYKSAFKNVSWEQKALRTVTAESEVTVPVMISRNNGTGNLDVAYTATPSEEGVFTDDCNGTIHFGDGQTTQFVKVKAANLQKGTTYTYTMTLDPGALDADTVLNKNVNKVVVTIVSDYTWVDAGTCIFLDGNFLEEPEEFEVPVLQALENKTIFRIYEPYQHIFAGTDDEPDFEDADDIEFYLNEDGSPKGIKSGGNLGAGYTLEYLDSYPSYCYFLRDGNTFTVGHLIGVDGTPTYVGGFQFIYEVPSLK